MRKMNIFLFLSLFLFPFILSQENDNPQQGSPIRAYLNLNNISTVFKNDGISDIDLYESNSGFVYPFGTGKTAVYISGFLWGAIVDDPNIPNVGGSTYRSGLQGGQINPDGTFPDPNSPGVRIFRVRADVYPGGPTINLSREAIDEGKTEQEIRAQYELDWSEWPADLGAPFKDIDGNNSFDPNFDIPGVPGASQTIWFVANDQDPARTQWLYGTLPMGIEYQATIWEYKNAGFLNNLLFRRYKLINETIALGNPKTFEDMYISMWSDPDIGYSTDDFAGCDTSLSMVYGINAYEFDPIYNPYPPPAIGFRLLKGPTISGNQNLPMTAAYYFTRGDASVTDPILGSPTQGALPFYRFMQGKIGLTGEPFINPITGLPTTYPLSGDPLTGEGWIDGLFYEPGDRRIGLATGPFNMAPGDTQEVVIAEIAALGWDRMRSFKLLKFYSALTEDVFNNDFVVPTPPVPSSPLATVTSTEWKIQFDWSEDTLLVSQIENFNQDGYAFQGYNVYQLPFSEPIIESGIKIATFDIVDGVTTIPGIVMDPQTGLPISGNIQNGTDSGIDRAFATNYDMINNTHMKVGKKYYFGITAYTYNADPQAVPNNSESLIGIVEAEFYENLPGANYGDTIQVVHSQGIGDGNVYVVVEDPTQLTGDDYEVSFHTQQQIRDPNGNWIPASTITRKFNPEDPDTLTGTTIDIAAVYGPNINTIDLLFHLDVVHHYYGWADGVTITFPLGTEVVEVPCIVVSGTEFGGCEPVEILGNVVKIGVTDNSHTQNGHFQQGGEDWIIRVNPNTYTMPLSVDWEVHDDGYAGGQNELGTTVVEEVGYATRLAKLWNLFDVTIGVFALEDISIVNGIDLFPPRDDSPTVVPNPIVDGFQINVVVGYDPPIGFSDLELFSPSGLTVLTSNGSTNTLDIQNYTIFGGVLSSKAIDNFGVGTNELEELMDDYELRFTGVYDSMFVGGQKVYYVVSGGQMATVFRMVNQAALANHPLNPNPGVAQPFLIRIPFEVWNVEDPNNQYQVNLTFRDRNRDGTENPFWAWNPTNRMYSILVNSPYDPTQVIQVDGGPDPFNDPATWILVHYGTNYHLDDIVTVIYKGPVQFGIDKFTFTTPDPVVSVEGENVPTKYQVFQNYPNPFNPSTIIRFTLPKQSLVKLEVYDILGQRVAELVNRELTAGTHEVLFDASNLASGVYFYMLNVKDKFFDVKKMILLK